MGREIAKWVPPGRALHLVDIENLLGDPLASLREVQAALEAYRGCVGVKAGDQVVRQIAHTKPSITTVETFLGSWFMFSSAFNEQRNTQIIRHTRSDWRIVAEYITYATNTHYCQYSRIRHPPLSFCRKLLTVREKASLESAFWEGGEQLVHGTSIIFKIT